jgi:hypothetical protein
MGALRAVDAWYNCTVASSVALLKCVSKQVFALLHDAQRFRGPESREPDRPGATQVFCERAPGLSCTAEIQTEASDEQFLLLQFHRVGHWAEALTPLKGFMAENVWATNGHHRLPRAAYSGLVAHGPAATVHVGLRQAPKPLHGDVTYSVSKWRKAEKRRFKAELITSDCRHIYIDLGEQKPDDLFFELGVILRQEDKIPASDINALDNALVRYLHGKFRSCRYDRDVAPRVLDTARRNFAEPENWPGLWKYLARTARELRRNMFRDDTPLEQRERFLDPACTIYSPIGAARRYTTAPGGSREHR